MNREMIRHAGHMVANRPDQALLISDQLHLVRKPLGIVHKEIEQLLHQLRNLFLFPLGAGIVVHMLIHKGVQLVKGLLAPEAP